MKLQDAMFYELFSLPSWTQLIGWRWLHEKIANHIIKKTRRKFERAKNFAEYAINHKDSFSHHVVQFIDSMKDGEKELLK